METSLTAKTNSPATWLSTTAYTGFYPGCALCTSTTPKTFGKGEAVAEVRKHRYSWTEVADRFLQSFHTLCLLPSQHHLHLPCSCVHRELGIAPFHQFYLTYTKPAGAKVLWTSHSRLLSWHQRHTSVSPSKFLASIFLEGCLLPISCQTSFENRKQNIHKFQLKPLKDK